MLEEVYLKGAVPSKGNDCNGSLLFAILAIDPNFLYRVLDSMTDDTATFKHYDCYDTDRLSMIWNTEQSTDLADSIFDYLHDKGKQNGCWLYQSELSFILGNRDNSEKLAKKQDEWIAHTIERYSNDGKECLNSFLQ